MTMIQATFDLDALMPAEVKPGELFYECGEHVQNRDWEAHLADCWHGECPACGTPITAWFDFHVNHGPAWSPAWSQGLCSKQHLLINHMQYICNKLDSQETTPNCFAVAHHGTHKSGGYFRNGAPVDCMVAEYHEKRAWLASHRVPSSRLPVPSTEAALEMLGEVAA